MNYKYLLLALLIILISLPVTLAMDQRTIQCLDNCIDSSNKRICHLNCEELCINNCENNNLKNKCIISCKNTINFYNQNDKFNSNIPQNISGTFNNGEIGINWTFEFWAMMGFFAIIVMAAVGWYIHRQTRLKTIYLLEMVDNTFNNFKFEKEKCIFELREIRKNLKNDYKKGKVDENNFDFILIKIDNYISELIRK